MILIERIPDMPDIYKCEIISNKRLNPSVFAISVDCRELAGTAAAGQFLNIKCGAERLLRRPVSICRVSGNTVEIVFEAKGTGTKWLSERRRGCMLDILGPLGNGFTVPDGRVIVAGGGIGTPPLLYAAQSAKGGADAVLGFRSADNIILKDAFDEVCGRVVIATDDGSSGVQGSVITPLEDLMKSGNYVSVLSCGPRAMLKAVAELCVRYTMHCQVSLEERMGCGVGACLVCACATLTDDEDRMSRVCADGPVFDAAEVIW